MYLPALGFCQALVALLMGLVGDCAAPTSSPHQQSLSEVLGNTLRSVRVVRAVPDSQVFGRATGCGVHIQAPMLRQ